MSLEGQTALITGASRGIGRAIAARLAREGARLLITARSAELQEAARELTELTEVHAVCADVTRPANVQGLFEEVRTRFDSLDILVNSAGVAEAAPVVETSADLWQKTLAVNLTATFLCSRAALEVMLPRRRGHIVNLISVAAIIPYAGNSAYAAAKAGALAFTRVLREEVRAAGIRVTAVLPGPTDTPLWDRFWPQAPREKMMSPAAVAEAVVSAILLPGNAVAEELILRPISGSL